jgi:hypothetical protein
MKVEDNENKIVLDQKVKMAKLNGCVFVIVVLKS